MPMRDRRATQSLATGAPICGRLEKAAFARQVSSAGVCAREEWESLGEAAARLLAGLEMTSPKAVRPTQIPAMTGNPKLRLVSVENNPAPMRAERRFRVVGLSSSSRADGLREGEDHRPVR